MREHKNLNIENAHKIHRWEVSDESELNDLSISPEDLYKIALDVSTGRLFLVIKTDPVEWKSIGSGESEIEDLNTINNVSVHSPTNGEVLKWTENGWTNSRPEDTTIGSTELPSFSYDEVLTSERWVDGKPIYRKTINFGSLPDSTEKTVPHGVSDIENAVVDNTNSLVWNSDRDLFFALYSTNGGYHNTARVSLTDVILRSEANLSDTNGLITIKYTKTTDTASSPVAKVGGQGETVPAGTVIYVASENPPTGYLIADGREISRTTYKDLFEVIGTTYGEGDGQTSFNLPDLRGEFIRGWDAGRGVDIDRQFGTSQDDLLKSHEHELLEYHGSNTAGVGYGILAKHGSTRHSSSKIRVTGGIETRPRNIALLACIKYTENQVENSEGSTTSTEKTRILREETTFGQYQFNTTTPPAAGQKLNVFSNKTSNNTLVLDGNESEIILKAGNRYEISGGIDKLTADNGGIVSAYWYLEDVVSGEYLDHNIYTSNYKNFSNHYLFRDGDPHFLIEPENDTKLFLKVIKNDVGGFSDLRTTVVIKETKLKNDSENKIDLRDNEETFAGWYRNGKPVYQIEIDGGTLPNDTEKIINIPNYNPAYTYWLNSNSFADNNNNSVPFNISHPQDSTYNIWCQIQSGNIQIVTGRDRSDYSSKIILNYTKD